MPTGEMTGVYKFTIIPFLSLQSFVVDLVPFWDGDFSGSDVELSELLREVHNIHFSPGFQNCKESD